MNEHEGRAASFHHGITQTEAFAMNQKLIDWVKERQKYYEQLAKSKRATNAQKLNYSSRALAFLEIKQELLRRALDERRTK